MASHHQPGGNVLPFGQPMDAPGPRYVKPIPAEQLARAMGEPIDLIEALRGHKADKPALSEGFWLAVGASAALWAVLLVVIYAVLS